MKRLFLFMAVCGVGLLGCSSYSAKPSSGNGIFGSSSNEIPTAPNTDAEHTAAPEPPAGNIPSTFKRVPKGEFRMGDGRYEYSPIHWVSISEFYMSETEVTVEQFRAFINGSKYITDAERETGDENGSWVYDGQFHIKGGVNWRCDVAGNRRPASEDKHPVIHVSYNDAVAYCAWLNRTHPVAGMEYRLPTEAEWEYAARGGEADIKANDYEYAGCNEADLGNYAWYNEVITGHTHPVGTKNANALGLHDMSGNVWEWCSDWYAYDYYNNSPKQDPENRIAGSNRVIRGGSWYNAAAYCRSAYRSSLTPAYRVSRLGFRLVLAARR